MGAITLTIEADLQNVRLIGLAVNRLVRDAGFTGKAADGLELAVVEAVNNVIEHAYRDKAEQTLDVHLELNGSGAIFNIVDSGSPMPRLVKPGLDFDPLDINLVPEGGYGLFIIHEVMDRVEYSVVKGKNVLTLTKALPDSAEEWRPES